MEGGREGCRDRQEEKEEKEERKNREDLTDIECVDAGQHSGRGGSHREEIYYRTGGRKGRG